MDLTKAIRELHAEKARLEKIICSLEELLAGNVEPAAPVTGKRRGRKFMNSQARKEVSERMKKYWAERRSQQGNTQQQGSPAQREQAKDGDSVMTALMGGS